MIDIMFSNQLRSRLFSLLPYILQTTILVFGSGEIVSSQSFTYSGPLTVPDASCGNGYQDIGESAVINVNLAGIIGTDVRLDSIRVNINLTYDSDLNLWLESPTGQVLELSTGNGGSGDNYINTVFKDNATSFITQGTPPFSGSYRPEGRNNTISNTPSNSGNLGAFSIGSTFNGLDANGQWILRMCDGAGGDIPVLQNWTIYFTVLCAGFSNDASPVEIIPSIACPGSSTIRAVIANKGDNLLDSVKVNWSFKNILRSPVVINKPIVSCNVHGKDTVDLGEVNLELGDNLIKVWTSSPNGTFDTNSSNDTLARVVKSGGLFGVFTIGGTNPNFLTFGEAIAVLNSVGVCGPTIFNVRNGTYNEQISLSAILGASSTNTITFQSETNDSTLVVLSFSSTSPTANYTLRLNGADYVTFHKITIEATNTSHGRAIDISGSANHNSFTNNIIRGVSTTSTSVNLGVVFSSSSSVNSENQFIQNRIESGSYGLYIEGNPTNGSGGWLVNNNVFYNQYTRGVYLSSLINPIIFNNTVNTNSNYSTYVAILPETCSGLKLSNNKILAHSGGSTGIWLYGCYGTNTNPCIVSNNFVSVSGINNGNLHGLYITDGSFIQVLHNTVVSRNTSPNSCVFYGQQTSNLTVLNNIFYHKGPGIAASYDGISIISNNNDYYTQGANVARGNGSVVSSLSEWHIVSGQDNYSISVNPQSETAFSFKAHAIELNNTAYPTPLVTTDINGLQRNISTPDIGAREFSPDSVDARLVAFDGLTQPIVSGNFPVKVVLKNNGSCPLTAAQITLQINNGTPTTTVWAGNLASGDTAIVSVGVVSLISLHPNNLRAWVSLLNDVIDSFSLNDSIKIDSLYAGMNGTYTIGGTTPNFSTFTAAVNTLSLSGVLGPVTFNIRNGTYVEQVVLRPTSGVNATNTVTFQSESGDSTGVILTWSATSDRNYTMQLFGADWFRVRKMTLRATNNTYGRVLELGYNAHYNVIENNILQGVSVINTDLRYAVLVSDGFRDTANVIQSNRILNGSYGMYWSGSSSAYEHGSTIRNNIFLNSYSCAIYSSFQGGLLVEHNKIETNSSCNSFYGISLYTNDNPQLLHNQMSLINGGYGLKLSASGNSTSPVKVVNNFIQINGPVGIAASGIIVESGDYYEFLHNTVRMGTSNPSAYALYVSSGQFHKSSNNILFNNGGGGALAINGSSNWVESDYNNLYVTGPVLINNLNSGQSISDLSNWQNSGNTTEEHSLSENPFFVASNDYRIAQIALNNAGKPTSITIDIEGQSRDVVSPDIGADEFMPLPVDAGIDRLIIPNKPFAVGNYIIRAVVRNHGSNSLTQTSVGWSINGVGQAPLQWTGNLPPGDTQSIVLGNISFTLGQGVNLKVWTFTPNSESDIQPVNDTSTVNNLYPGLVGIYTIGATASDFTTFGAANTALKNGGVVGATTFNVRNGFYHEQLDLTSIVGANSTNTITFQSETNDSTSVILEFNSTLPNQNYVLQLTGADWFRFRKLTLRALNNTYARIVTLQGGADNNILESNRFIGVATSSTSDFRSLLYSPSGTTDLGNIVRSNLFLNGSDGVFIFGTNDTNLHESGTQVINNRFENQYRRSINLIYQEAPLVEGNRIESNTTYTLYNGIVMFGCSGNLKVTKNILALNTGSVGIAIDNCNGTVALEGVTANNFVQLGGSQQADGILFTASTFQNGFFNSVHINSTNIGSRAFSFIGGDNLRIFNNIGYNSTDGLVIWRNSGTNIAEANHNNWFTTGANLAFMAHTNVFSHDLATWKTLSGFDANSISVNPLFKSTTDLHTSYVKLDAKGTSFSEVLIDIDGQYRDPMTPDIGADEFSSSDNESGVFSIDKPNQPFASGVQPVCVTLINNGLDTLESVQVYWTINGVAQPPFNWTGNLLSGDQINSVAIGNFEFAVGTQYNIRAWTFQPNGMTDFDVTNDTAQVTNLYAALGGIYTIGGTNPDFSTFNAANTAISQGGLLAPVIFNVRNGLYNEQILIKQYLGASSYNHVTFQSESGDSSGVRLIYNSTSDSANYVIQLDGAKYITFKYMTIEATNSDFARVFDLKNGASWNIVENNTLKSKNRTIILANSNDLQYNEIRYNKIIGGNYGVYYKDGTGVVICNNVFENQKAYGIFIENVSNPKVYNNVISTSVDIAWGIQISYCNEGFQIYNNKISVANVGIGIQYCENSNGTQIQVFNNFISVDNIIYSGAGLYINSSSRINIYHNSVYCNHTYFSGGSVDIRYSINVSLLNNIFYSNAGYSIQSWSNDGLVSDYNNLYTNSTILIRYDFDFVNLADWRILSLQDQNSLSVDPLFASNIDLHASASSLDRAALPIPIITRDIDGDIRDPQAPDIGADEFFHNSPNDMGVAAILSPNKQTPFAIGNHPVIVEVKNFGTDTVHTAIVKWKVNNALQTNFTWSGILAPNERDTIVIGNYSFGIAENSISAWTLNPDGMADTITVNDSTNISGLYPALNGVYTIGGVLPNFGSFGQAVNYLTKGGVMGPVTFNIRSGLYTETLAIKQFKGSGPTNPVIFQSENGSNSGVRITNNTFEDVVLIDGADYLSFKNLTIENTISYDGTVFQIQNGSHHISLLNCKLKLPTGNINGVVLNSRNSQDDFLTVKNCFLENGSYGIYLNAPGVSSPEAGLIIDSNLFENQYSNGISAQYLSAPQINRNLIVTNWSNSGFSAVYIYYISGGGQILKNQISVSEGNGLSLSSCNGTSDDRLLIANNFVAITGGSTANRGLFINYGSEINIFYNTIRVGSTNTSSAALYNFGGTNKFILNNIFSNFGGGLAIYNYLSTNLTVSNFNDLYTTGSILGQWNGINTSNLTNWRSISGKDFNSLSIDPLFTSLTDLHISQTALDSAASYTVLVPDDIDNSARNLTHPDIGADEIGFLADDAGITQVLLPQSGCALTSSQPVKVRVQNFSAAPISGIGLAFQVDGGVVITENMITVVPPGQVVDYTFNGMANLSAPGGHTIKAWTVLTGDTDLSNDTTLANIQNVGQPVVPSNLLPANGTLGVSPVNIMFSWAPSNSATAYDLFLWKQGTTPPTIPTVSNITQINYYYSIPNPDYGATYVWKINAKNQYCFTAGPVQNFTLFNLPDLIVQNVQAPTTAFTGQPLTIGWTVKNMATGGTGMGTWLDGIYLSDDAILDLNTDLFLGTVPNFSALNPNQSYANTATFTIPNGFVGTYYVFVIADVYNALLELSNNNNKANSLTEVNIQLTPPPDLQVTSIIPPNNAFSSKPITINYTVSNLGTGPTMSGNWQDRMYFGPNASLNLGQAVLLGTFNRSGDLAVAANYTRTITGTIPQGISGTYYVHVVTDYFNDEYEQANEGNNTSVSTPIMVTLTPPADLIVTSVSGALTGNNLQQVNVSWMVENQGGSPADQYWYDQVWLSQTPSNNTLTGAISLGTFGRPLNLDLGATYTRSVSVVIPDKITGPYYFHVKADAGNGVFEYSFENNNVRGATTAIQVRTPDLALENLVAPPTGNSGDSILVQWQVRNVGLGKLTNRYVTDAIFISTSQVYSTTGLTQLGTVSGNLTLDQNAVQNRQLKVVLPKGTSGQYYVYVFTDQPEAIYEGGNETNNRNTNGRSLSVNLTPWPDLTPTNVTPPAAGAAGASVAVNYTVQNVGTAPVQGQTWKDKIYLQNTPVWNPGTAQLLRTETVNQNLAIGSNYSINTTIGLPLGLLSGNYYVFVVTDADNDLYEYTGENNNRIGSTAIVVTGYPPVDLAATSLTAPASAMSGQNITANWQVANISGVNTIVNNWSDAIYLSADTIFSVGSDQQLATRQQFGLLASGASYTALRSFNLPNGISGNYYLIVVVDHTAQHNDSNTANNRRASSAFAITLTPPPDLLVEDFTAPAQSFSGQQLEVYYTIKNTGAGTATGSWTDRLYLSTDFLLDASDPQIGAKTRKGGLPIGAAYMDTITASVTLSQFGNRILILKTDDNNAVYEYQSEGNNTASSNITLVLPPPSDLVVQNIIVPVTSVAGKDVTVSWRVRNVGANPANGLMKEAVYFSADTIWDVGDALLGTKNTSLNLAPGASSNQSLTSDLVSVGLGNYYAIVRTDLLNNINEISDTNNLLVHVPPVNVEVTLLPLNTLKQDTLEDSMPLYYRIEIADSLAGESLLVQLKGDTLNATNELYLRFGQVPSRSTYDFNFTDVLSANHDFVVPTLQAGTYYLLAYGNTSVGTKQPVTLFAKVLDFEIRKVTANRGGNNGKVTVRVDGAKFVSGMDVYLERPGYSIPALCVIYEDPTRVFVQFDLRNRPQGTYDLVAAKSNGETARLDDGFTIEPGSVFGLATNIVTPADSRPNNIITMKVEFQNNGNTDIMNPVVTLLSLDGAPVALETAGLLQGFTALNIPLQEIGTPPGWLRPGAAGTVTVYVKATKALSFLLQLPEGN
jgi:parallel beta-helix repeat protein